MNNPLEPNRNAEAYRNHQINSELPKIEKHLDFIEFSQDGHMLLGCSNLSGRYWCGSLWYFKESPSYLEINKSLTSYECESGVCDAKFLDDTQKIIFCEDSGVIQIVTLFNEEEKQNYRLKQLASSCEHDDSVLSLSIFSDNKHFVSGGFDTSIKVWNIEFLLAEQTYRCAHAHTVTTVSARPLCENTVFASSSLDKTALLWDNRQHKPATVILKSADKELTSLAWHSSLLDQVVIGSSTGEILILDIRQPNITQKIFKSFSRPIHKLKFSNDRSDLLAVCADDSQIKVLDCSSEHPVELYSDNRHQDFVRGLAWHPKTNNLHTCGWDKQVFLHNVSTSKMELNGANSH